MQACAHAKMGCDALHMERDVYGVLDKRSLEEHLELCYGLVVALLFQHRKGVPSARAAGVTKDEDCLCRLNSR